MDGFLVLIRCGMDDLPVRLFKTKAVAKKFAMKMGEKEIEEAKEAFLVDSSIFIGVDIVTFRSGRVASTEAVRNFDELPVV